MAKTLHSPEQEALVVLLREKRLKAGFTQTELAERLGRPQSFVSKVESGERRLDIVELRSVCRALNVKLVAFVKEFENAVS